ncbi:MAG: Crp/Fnr family transcriptional regulator [Verrucomicrobiales bacterium]|nr:Crp/Fnr family transcriptional regulator [Verrucomicrobiales bacterium]
MSNILDICRDLPEKRFEEGECIIHEEVRDGRLYILKEGSVEVVKKDVRINTVSSRGVVLGEVSFLLDRPHITSVKALEPCVLYVCDDPLEFLTKHPEVNLYIAQMLARRLNAVTDYLVELSDQVDANEDERGVADVVLKSIMQHYSNKSL